VENGSQVSGAKWVSFARAEPGVSCRHGRRVV